MHLAAVLALTIVCIAAMLWLSILGRPIPDAFPGIATGGAFYLIGTQTANKWGAPKDAPKRDE